MSEDLKQRIEAFKQSKFTQEAATSGLQWVVTLVQELTEREARLVEALKEAALDTRHHYIKIENILDRLEIKILQSF